MADNPQKPTAVILGGLNTHSRALAGLLVPVDGEPLVSHLRIVDKFSVAPATTYLGAEFPRVLEKPFVEYRQANLTVPGRFLGVFRPVPSSHTVPATVSAALEPPEGQQPYDYVFDFTGEVRHDRTEVIQIKTTCHIARLIGLEAAKRKNKAYVRVQLPFYQTSSKGIHDEKEDVKPNGVVGTWWHETLRMLAAIEDLNLVILRIGFTYGPYVNFGTITSAMTVGAVYGYIKKPMKSMWAPGKNPTHTIHVDDVAGAAWACARWMAPLGRKAANSAAGEVIPFHNDKSKVKEVEGMPVHDEKLVAPLFNLVDDASSTLLSVGQVITSFFGTSFEFFNLLESAKLKLADDAVEDINDHHVSGWTEMITNAKPPIPNTPLSAYMDSYALEKHVVAFSNSKIKDIVGYQLKYPEFNHANLKEIIDKWKVEGSWPIVE